MSPTRTDVGGPVFPDLLVDEISPSRVIRLKFLVLSESEVVGTGNGSSVDRICGKPWETPYAKTWVRRVPCRENSIPPKTEFRSPVNWVGVRLREGGGAGRGTGRVPYRGDDRTFCK